ncbi:MULTISPECIES: ornithine decarboxylase [unclassified Clostridium]|uniref:ornithine decarboxylase n=1 Tax=unclassified Clostridium TaxID=2614128 RepID=UPI001898A6A4|nr:MULTISPECIES: ornithine decarboxylase [unclassified Clostridium]MBO5131417.1 ornithine decarboxylase [Romboutsia sp.]MBP3917408.1 ornithine decarboxylase [Clostridium sp.]MEE0933291.1 ornithine decarboxylase [Clostridium sp.]
MKSLKIACTERTRNYFFTDRETIEVGTTDYTDVAAAVVNESDIESINDIYDTRFGISIFVLAETDEINDEIKNKVHKIIHINELNEEEFSKELNKAADKYEEEMLPPFFDVLSEYSRRGNLQFACPGHQGGQYFVKHPAGRAMYEFFGENIFKSDICNADVDLGDLLIHEGPAMSAQAYAAKVYNADKTYFVMNGTSTSNSVVINAIVSPGDLVLFDRNNHKSIYNSALVSSAGKPVYLETSRNPFGFIGGIDAHCFNEDYLRSEASKVDSKKAREKRPFRLAVIQLGTYDGTIYNARQVVDKIGHLCDYILFDSAWVGYEQFIPMMRDCSPLLLDLKPEDPGILVTQSIHKQQAGFSQTSQIHKKDSHLRGQKRYVDHKRFNNAYMLYASTSPFYPLFAALDVNARMQDGEAGRKLWADCIKVGIEARKDVLERCELLKPFIPPVVNGKPWQDYPTEEIANNIEFFKFYPGEKWHSFEGYGENQYFVDPNKFMLTTPGINVETGEYEDFGIPATILANYLRDHRVVPEKSDLNSILFLLTPAESTSKMKGLVDHLVRFENLINEDAPLSEVLPKLYAKYEERYKGYTIRRLCQEMHDFYKKNDAKTYQKLLFRRDSLPEYVMNPNEANVELKRNNAKLVPLSDIVGEIALEGALPYPPGVFCVVPGERWNTVAQKYFSILEEGINKFPGFAPEIQGVYLEKEDGKVRAYGYVLDK